MYDRILVPLDGSPLAEAVLPHAEGLASTLGSRIHLVQVVHQLSQLVGLAGPSDATAALPAINMEVLIETTEREAVMADAYLQRVAEGLQSRGLEATWEVRRGNPGSELIQCVQDQDIQLVAISTHGRAGLGRFLFGSVANRVAREAGVPVLLIRPEQDA